MNDREKWQERVRVIRASSTTWWWWWWCVLVSSLWVLLSCCALVFIRRLLLNKNAFFFSCYHFSLTAIDSHGIIFESWFGLYTLGCLFHVGSNKVFIIVIWILPFRYLLKSVEFFSYCYGILIYKITIGECGPVITLRPWFVSYSYVGSGDSLSRRILWSKDTLSKMENASQFKVSFTHFLLMNI